MTHFLAFFGDIADKFLGEKVPDRLQHQHAGHQGAGSQVSTGVYQHRLILQGNLTILRRHAKNVETRSSKDECSTGLVMHIACFLLHVY